MSALVMGMVFKRYPGEGNELLLALALADHAHDDGTRVFPSVASLAAKVRQSERSVQYKLAGMLRSGWLQKVSEASRGRGLGKGTGTEYRINPDWIAGRLEILVHVEQKGANASTAGLQASDSQGDEIEKGANISPFIDAGEKGASPGEKGCKTEFKRGAIAVAPKPSVNKLNHHNSNRQREAQARDDASPPTAPGGGLLVPFPLDWEPDETTLAMLRMRKLPLPSADVVATFVGSTAAKHELIELRRVPLLFLAWMGRERAFAAGRSPQPVGDADVIAKGDAEFERLRKLARSGSYPQRGSLSACAEAGLAAINGFGAIETMRERDVEDLKRAFTTAFCERAVALGKVA